MRGKKDSVLVGRPYVRRSNFIASVRLVITERSAASSEQPAILGAENTDPQGQIVRNRGSVDCNIEINARKLQQTPF